ncbi:phosphopantetheine-binding protein [Streptomyces sp. SGAir0957]
MDRTEHTLDLCVAGLLRHPAVAGAEATAAGDARRIVYVLPAEGHTLDDAELRHHLDGERSPLPGETALVPVPEFPRAEDGSVDRADLAVYGVLGGLLTLWREAFDNERIGPDDDFFTLGGYSMLAVRLIGRIADRYGVDLPLAEFFDLPTVLDVAYSLVESGADPAAPEPLASAADELSLEDLLAGLDQLSDEQALNLLGPDTPPADGIARG